MEDMNLGGMNTDGFNAEATNTAQVDTSGLNADTFGMNDNTMNVGEETKIYTTDYTSEGGYTIPGYGSSEALSTNNEGKGLEIATLVFGILSLVICCCNGLFGLIGLILGIIAMVKGKKNGLSIAGLVCSILGLLCTIGMVAFSMTDYGQELQDAFWDGFEQGYEASSGEDISIGDDEKSSEEESWVSDAKPHEGTKVVSDAEASKITIDGKEISIPCKLSDILAIYEVADFSDVDVNQPLESYESELISLQKDGKGSCLSVTVANYTDETIPSMKEGTIVSVMIDTLGENPEEQISVYNGISIGMSQKDLEAALKDITYNVNGTDYTYYDMYMGVNEDYYLSIYVSNGVVEDISLYCSK